MDKKKPLLRDPECIHSRGTECEITSSFLCKDRKKCPLRITHEEYTESCRIANDRLRSLPEYRQMQIAAMYYNGQRVWEEKE